MEIKIDELADNRPAVTVHAKPPRGPDDYTRTGLKLNETIQKEPTP